MMLFHSHAMGQSSKITFTPRSSALVPMTEQQGIKVSYLKGDMKNMPAICLDFQNTSQKEMAFTWTLLDNNGHVVYKGNTVKLNPGQALDLQHNPALKNRMIFVLNKGVAADNYQVNINLEN